MAKPHTAATETNKSKGLLPAARAGETSPAKLNDVGRGDINPSPKMKTLMSRNTLLRWCVTQVKCQEPTQRMPAGYVKVFDDLIEEFELAGKQKDYGSGIDGWEVGLALVFEHLAETEGFVTCGPSVQWIPADVYAKCISGRDIERDYLFDLFFRTLGLEELITVSKKGAHLRWQSGKGFTSRFGFAFDVPTKITNGTALFCTRSLT
ncbi:MAG: hypothetical protein EOR00_24295 [Mesorhizobium sp.]|uniref:hypothetical protein n=1 Tax=Mesorhizobium sp. TaxID=1871066 RepID=UPI000FE9AB39|nr:hypothetical protein [Mesorhizobium sp.]RWP13963.1 MAG: hypothetical protein EOR00_24295 [Mesorhizobium sp.]